MKPVEYALQYESMGWSIIPIRPKSRTPYINWTRYQNERATPEQIINWYTKWPNAGIAIITGRISGLVVIDVDPRKGGNTNEVLREAPTKLITRTGGGGNHLFYEYPKNTSNVPNRVGIDNGVDIRADGGFVFAPPSIHADTGRRYKWQTTGSPGDIPQEIVQAIIMGETSPSTNLDQESSERWLSEMWSRGVQEGKRNDSTARFAGYYAAKGCPQDTVLSMMNLWNQINDPPLSNSEISTIVKSVFKTKFRREASSPRPIITPSATQQDALRIMSIFDYMAEYGSIKTDWIVDEWLPYSTIGFIVAAPGSYKTWMLLDLAISVASGTPFLGLFSTKKKGPVLVIQQEDWHGQMAERTNVIVHSRFKTGIQRDGDEYILQLPPPLPIFFHPDRQLRFDDTVLMDMLEYHIAKIKPQLVLIDPLNTATSTEDYMSRAPEHMARLKYFRDKYGCSFIIAHHTKKREQPKKGKREDPSTEREEGWGSQFLNAFLETGWQIRKHRDEDDVVVVRRHFKTSKNKNEIMLKFDINTDTTPIHYRVQPYETMEEVQLVDGIVELMESPKTLVDLLDATGLSRTTLQRKLRKLVKEGVLLKNGERYIKS